LSWEVVCRTKPKMWRLARQKLILFYQSYRAVDVDDPRSHYIIACMAAKGYDFIISPADCNSQHPLASQAACYAPNSWLAGFIDQFRRPLK
jgi:hypothetical protein